MPNDHKCAYAPCDCQIGSDQQYCSEACRYNDGRAGAHVAEEECDCGHPACATDEPPLA